jgi:uncharacterized protein (DUF427 family)
MTILLPENVQSYPRPPLMEAVPHRIEVRLGGKVVALSDHAFRVLETHHAPTYYLRPDDVSATLIPVVGSSFCEWKGRARYFDVLSGDVRAVRGAWSYDNPSPRFAALAGFFAFYPALMEECSVGGVLAMPQPGGFYGGWVTPNLEGQIKGQPGTTHW